MEYKSWQKKGNERHYKTPFKRLYTKLCRGASRKNIEVDITYETFLEFTKIDTCQYCGDKIDWIPHGKLATRYNLDRKRNDKGYTKENCIVCCKTCNFLKSNMNEAQFLKIIHKIYNTILR